MTYTYKTKGVCPTAVSFDLENGILSGIAFSGGGCRGNHSALAKLLEGTDAETCVKKLLGNRCGFRDTSCADQLARAVQSALNEGAKKD